MAMTATAALAWVGVVCIGLTACGISDCGELPTAAGLPQTLAQTGLYGADGVSLGSGVRAYRPSFELWSDGAEKRRWAWLPEGAQIDTSDMDDWQFPVGTKLWKEFSRDGKRLETRLLSKESPAPADWRMVSYVWDQAGKEATVALAGEEDVHGTDFDVPAADECLACHEGVKSRVLGFSALQLAAQPAASSAPGPASLWTLERLVAEGRLSRVPQQPLTVPGDAVDRAALGYLHANCGSCHSQSRPARCGPRCYDPQKELDLRLRVGALQSVSATATFRTAVGSSLVPGDSDASILVTRSERRFFRHMPPLATERVDEAGMAMIRRWVDRMDLTGQSTGAQSH